MKMKKTYSRRALSIVILSIMMMFMSCSKPTNQTSLYNTDDDFIKHNYTQVDISNDPNFKSFKLIDPYINDKIVYFTAESHDTEINTELEFQFLKYFKSKAGIKYYLQELSYSDAIFLNKYLETGDESILKKLYEPFKGTFAWNKQSYEKWKKVYDYNRTLPENQKIVIVGIDIEHQSQNAIWGMYSLIPDSEPPISIKPSIDELKALYKSSINGNSRYNSKIVEFSKRLKDSISQYHDDYEKYFGDSLFDFQIINDNILNTIEAYYKQDGSRQDNQVFNAVRDKKMYENFLKIYSHLPQGKYYGQFGLNHAFQKMQGNIDWLASLMNSSASPVKGKILSIAYVYEDCQQMYPSNGSYFVGNMSDYASNDGLLEPYLKSDLVLFRLVGKGSPFKKRLKWYFCKETPPYSGVTTDYYQFLLFIKGSKPTVPLGE